MLNFQIFLFFILISVWALPETILIRNTCLILGAIFSLPTLIQYRKYFSFQSVTISIFILFIWVTLHLIFFGQDPDLQWREYGSIWKRSVIGFIYAMGMGILLLKYYSRTRVVILCLILSTPTVIFLIKYCFTIYEHDIYFRVPDFMKIYSGSAPYYIPKTAYSIFCFPLLFFSSKIISKYRDNNFFNLIPFFILSISIVLVAFYLDKNLTGIVLSLSTSIYFLAIFINSYYRKNPNKYFYLPLFAIIFFMAAANFLPQTQIFLDKFAKDMVVTTNISAFQDWKLLNAPPPKNEEGIRVNDKYYKRITWALSGVKLTLIEPLGYGLVEGSYGKLAKKYWPDSVGLTQSHLGWLDFALGLGFPGLFIIWLSIYCGVIGVGDAPYGLKVFIQSVLVSNFLVWTFSETSQRVYLDCLIFYIGMAAGVSLALRGLRKPVNNISASAEKI